MSAEEDARKMENSHLDEARNEGLALGRSEGRLQGLTEGRNEGRIQGVAVGRNERNIEIAKNMLSKNMDINLIMELTNLSEEEIKKLTE